MKKIIFFVFALAAALGTKAQQMPEHLLKLMYTGNIISNFYVDSPDNDKIAEEAVKAMLKELDPHSTYTDKKETKALLEQMQGSFSGIGIQYNMVSDTLYVIQTTPNGPSERAGILAGDKVVEVNDTVIAGVKMTRTDIMSRLRGKKGSQVKVGIVRRGINRMLEFNLVRDDISTETVDAAYMIDKKNGYIRITSFGAKTHNEFVAKLDSLKGLGMRNLVLDLQGNGGGFLNAAVDIANEFLARESLVVYTEGRTTGRHDYMAQGGGRFLKGNVAVLVDETSASAAEILAGAIQDWDRGVVVGRRSFGKGLVQRPFELFDGSMIRLTIARYYTPSGRCIQKPYSDSIKYEDDLMRRYNSGEMSSVDSIHFADSLKTKTLRLGRTVYGGGGIMPDYFVPMDTTKYTAYHRALAAKGSIIQASLRYLDENREELVSKYRSIEEFDEKFVVDDRYMTILREQALKDSVELKGGDEELARTLPELKKQLKMYIARDLWDMSEFIMLYNKYSDSFQKAYELVRCKNMDKVLLKK
ncbi:MAG: PDZ domain-containing protein [Bacteroidaceae bacterium]|nr:PDZ domain-containing protein [Bacteroidaceae bacterium]MBP3408764.1 PDZ domain-containing protein [Bacteroidaceae bacterium]